MRARVVALMDVGRIPALNQVALIFWVYCVQRRNNMYLHLQKGLERGLRFRFEDISVS